MTEDPAPAVAARLVVEVDQATARLEAATSNLSDTTVLAPSRLEGWSRANILAHLAHVASVTLRMTDDALAGRPTTMYPGGPAERESSIRDNAQSPAAVLLSALNTSSGLLAARWRQLRDEDWMTPLGDDRVGPMRLGRLVALRLTEVEVHHVDLDVAYSPDQWTPAFVEACLPLRIAWLGAHHRRRPTADTTVNGSWLLRCTDTDDAWLVTTDGPNTVIGAGAAAEPADSTIAGTRRDLFCFLLGRQPPTPLAIDGDVVHAAAFKQAFPGP